MGTHNCLSALHINGCQNYVIHLDGAADHLTAVQILAALILLDIGDLETAIANQDHAVVSSLTAHFRIEGGFIQNNDTLFSAGNRAGDLFAYADSDYLCLTVIDIIAHKIRRHHIGAKVNTCPAQVTQCLAGFPGTELILLTLAVEGIHIHGHTLVFQHFHGQIHRETVGSGKQEGILAGEHCLALCLVSGQLFGENAHTGIDGTGKVLLLSLDHTDHVVSTLPQIGVVALILFNNGRNHFIQEGLIYTQQLAVTGCPAQQAAQHIAAAFIGGLHAVSDHKGGCADMVGNHT